MQYVIAESDRTFEGEYFTGNIGALMIHPDHPGEFAVCIASDNCAVPVLTDGRVRDTVSTAAEYAVRNREFFSLRRKTADRQLSVIADAEDRQGSVRFLQYTIDTVRVEIMLKLPDPHDVPVRIGFHDPGR